MQPYTEFAAVYDLFMDNVPYDEWADYLEYLLKQNKISQGLVLELGCGTGSITRRMSAKGYDMIGIDYSQEMLTIAREKSAYRDDKILYLCQDMREFELYGTVAAVVSVCDSMNYIMSEEDLISVFRLVNNYLDPGGLFIFDLDTEYDYETILGDNTIAENREEGSFIWENTYYPEEMANEVNLTLFLPDEEPKENVEFKNQEQEDREVHNDSDQNNRIYHKYEETHYRRAYTLDTIKQLIEKAGMEFVTVYDALTEKEPPEDSERVYVIAREKHQKDKLYL